jgi:hypothetical protein
MAESLARVRNIKTPTSRGGDAAAFKAQSAISGREARKSAGNNVSDPEVATLLDTWKLLSVVERGQRLRPLIERYSERSLARLVKCSEARVRQLVDLTKLSPEAERDLRERRIGVKKALTLVRKARDIEQRRRLISTDPASRQKLIDRGASLIIDWILGLFSEAYAIQFLGIIKSEEYGPDREIFLRSAPKPAAEWRLLVNPQPGRSSTHLGHQQLIVVVHHR